MLDTIIILALVLAAMFISMISKVGGEKNEKK